MSALTDISERDEELYRAYKAAWAKPNMTEAKAIEAAIASPTSRYWVSQNNVYREILARLRGYHTAYDPTRRRRGKARRCKANLYDDLFREYRRIAGKRYFKGYSTHFIVSFVVMRQAPRFYLSFRRARAIIERLRKEKRNMRRRYDTESRKEMEEAGVHYRQSLCERGV